HTVFQDPATRREKCCTGCDRSAEAQQIVLIAAGPMKKQERWSFRIPGRLEAMNEIGHGHHAASFSRGGNTFSISARCGSRNAGNLSDWPKEATGSSTAKPGMSVAISNRTPPGSRK